MDGHYIRVQSIAGWQLNVNLWLECSCGWKSSDADGSMDIDSAYLIATKHRNKVTK